MTVQMTTEVSEFLDRGVLGHFIGGQEHLVPGQPTIDVLNPSDGSVVATILSGSSPEVAKAVESAKSAFPAWAGLSPDERAKILNRFADRLQEEALVLSHLESLDVGKAITNAEGFDIPFGIECVRYFAKIAAGAVYDTPLDIDNFRARTHRAPYGVCGFIFPWNFPFDLLMWGVIPALAAGNTVVVKPAGLTPLSTLYAARLATEAGMPDGVFNVVLGAADPGIALTEHPDIKRMSFTGSPQVGQAIGKTCGQRLVPCKLELGGKGAAVVFNDVDIASVAESLAGAITLNTGQVCCTATRWIIQDSIYDDFVDAVSNVLSKVKIGPGLDPQTQMGPLVSQTQRKRVLDYLSQGKADGADVILGGGEVQIKDHPGGFYVKPYLLGGSTDNVCFREEIFGPTAFLTSFTDEDQAIGYVNRLEYGLANSVWTSDLERADRVACAMTAGNSWINTHNIFAYGLPYGGINLSGNGGGVNSPQTFYDYLRDQTIARLA